MEMERSVSVAFQGFCLLMEGCFAESRLMRLSMTMALPRYGNKYVISSPHPALDVIDAFLMCTEHMIGDYADQSN
jgi:hypothetical protein